MNIATLIVEGSDAELDAIKSILQLHHDSRWRKGDARRNAKLHDSSGFLVTIADCENPGALVSGIRQFLAQCKETGVHFPARGLTAELSVGFTVGDSVQFVAGVELLPADLLVLAECGIVLGITAYPTSDDANAI